ncbi:MAG: DUF885 domain-containing protein [Brachybacterium sp.]|nr:DUF885 domain-containing protein [Brachybacterium sp.]
MSADAPSPSARRPSALDELADRYVDTAVAKDPFLATTLGVPGHDAEVTDFSPDAISERTEDARRLLRDIQEVPDSDDTDTVTRAALEERLGLEIALDDALISRAQVNNLASPLQMRDVLDQMPTDTAEDWEVIAERMSGFPRALEGWTETLRDASIRGESAARRQLQLGAEQARGYADPETGFFASFARDAEAPGLDDALRARLTDAARTAADAYRQTADVLDELAEGATTADSVGEATYVLCSQVFLGEKVDLDETYEWGVEELRRIIAEQEDVAMRLNAHYGTDGGRDIAAAREALARDRALTLSGTDALQEWMQTLSDQAIEDLAGTHFDVPEPLRRLECKIARTGSGGIYYTGPSEDLSRPGRMWWDVPHGVTEFHTWAETTTVYHEGVPGHHLQVGTQTMQAQSLNRWRALMCWVSGHGEGWALYAERLMDELGYLGEDADRMGMLDAQRLRAGRVVLDIGLHVGKQMPTDLPGSSGGGWHYDSAWDFMSANWGLEEAHQRFELHRYLGWPGQAPSYKVGQRVWEQLRAEATARGEDARDFHRRALELGSLPLSVLKKALA